MLLRHPVAYVLIAILAACIAAPAPAAEPEPTLRGLFIGNSYTDYHVLPKQVAAMCAAAGIEADFQRQTTGGYTWERHWQEGEARERIQNEPWDFVVLQNHSWSTLGRREQFDDYGDRFLEVVKSSGATPILYLTWRRADRPDDQPTITEGYSTLAVEHGAKVAPVGVAFQRWLEEHPDVSLHTDDNSHPTMAGSYLAACVFYATITGKSPVGMPAQIEGYNWVTKGQHLADLDPGLAAELQSLAWEVVQAFDPADHAKEAAATGE